MSYKIKDGVASLVEQMGEPMPLPLGRKEFEDWSDRIISGALLPGEGGKVPEYAAQFCGEKDPDEQRFIDSQKFVLANMLLHIMPTESHKPDAYFIHALRVAAIKQVAVMMGEEINLKKKTRIAKEAAAHEALTAS